MLSDGSRHVDTTLNVYTQVPDGALRAAVEKLYADVGRLAEAEALLNRLLEGARPTLGEEHPLVLSALNNLAAVYYSQGKYAELDRCS